jgi:hypothetical protein
MSTKPALNDEVKLSKPLAAQIHLTHEQCAICSEPLGLARSDGQTEKATVLPCSHIFGDICILRWLELDSPHHDCPSCRRKMVYRGCGCMIRPRAVRRGLTLERGEGARVKVVSEEDMPDKCPKCRGDEIWERSKGGMVFRYGREREMMVGERILERWRREQERDVPASLEKMKRDWSREIDIAFGTVSEEELDEW